MKCVMYGLLSPVTPSQTAGSRSKLALMSAQLSVYFLQPAGSNVYSTIAAETLKLDKFYILLNQFS